MSLFKTLIALAAAATFAAATPMESAPSVTAQQCGNGQTLSCCNSSSGTLIGLNCITAQIPVAGAPLSQTCGSNVAACCSKGDNGLIVADASCNPVTL